MPPGHVPIYFCVRLKMKYKHHYTIPAIYMTISLAYIYASDKALAIFVADKEWISNISMFKGTVFVLVTTCFLVYLIKRALDKEVGKEKEKQRFLNANVGAMNHIMAKFVNKIEIFHTYAAQRDDFDKVVLRLFEDLIKETKLDINRISDIDNLTDSAIYEIIHTKKVVQPNQSVKSSP